MLRHVHHMCHTLPELSIIHRVILIWSLSIIAPLSYTWHCLKFKIGKNTVFCCSSVHSISTVAPLTNIMINTAGRVISKIHKQDLLCQKRYLPRNLKTLCFQLYSLQYLISRQLLYLSLQSLNNWELWK